MGARLFTAVLPPESVVQELSAYLEPRLEAGREQWRWTHPEGWHLTTAFMASVPVNALEQLEESLSEAMARTPAFEVGVGGALCFPNAAQTRVLALGVNRGVKELEALAGTCRRLASKSGASPDGATFKGHLTLARARKPFDATKWFHIVDSFPGWNWTVDEIALVESHMADRGNRYEVLERFALSKR